MTDTTEDDVLEVRPDGRKSRLAKRDRPPVAGFDPDDVGSVDAKVAEFREAHPKGSIKTKVEWYVDSEGRHVYVAVAKARTSAGGYVDSIGTATRTHGVGEEPYANFPLETAESVAIGRALRFLGFKGEDGTLPPIPYIDARSLEDKET